MVYDIKPLPKCGCSVDGHILIYRISQIWESQYFLVGKVNPKVSLCH